MHQLVGCLQLSTTDEAHILAELTKWETNGNLFESILLFWTEVTNSIYLIQLVFEVNIVDESVFFKMLLNTLFPQFVTITLKRESRFILFLHPKYFQLQILQFEKLIRM